MSYACMHKTASDDDIDVPIAAAPQLNNHISPRTPCISMRMQD